MTFRSRSIGPQTVSGSCTKGTVIDNRSYLRYSKVCDDSVTDKPYSDHALFIEEYSRNPCLMSGTTGTPGTIGYRLASGCPVGFSTATSHEFISGTPSDSSVATQTLARTNPSRPHVQLPVFFAELRELPRLLRDLGRKYRYLTGKSSSSVDREAASSLLSIEFGIKPLVSDLSKMLDFTRLVDERAKELASLRENGGLSRTYQSFTGAAESSSNVTIESYLTTVRARRMITTTRQKWGAVRWVPNETGLPSSSSEQRRLAQRLVFGLHSSQIVSNVWEALPWSWLIDWFSDVGDYLTAVNNSVAIPSGLVNVCTNTKTQSVLRVFDKPSWLTVNDGSDFRETKQRTLASPSPISASWPILTNRQLSILGALAVLKVRR